MRRGEGDSGEGRGGKENRDVYKRKGRRSEGQERGKRRRERGQGEWGREQRVRGKGDKKWK